MKDAQRLGGKLVAGGKEYKHSNEGLNGGFWLEPSIVFYGAAHPETMEEETFAPILRELLEVALLLMTCLPGLCTARCRYFQKS